MGIRKRIRGGPYQDSRAARKPMGRRDDVPWLHMRVTLRSYFSIEEISTIKRCFLKIYTSASLESDSGVYQW